MNKEGKTKVDTDIEKNKMYKNRVIFFYILFEKKNHKQIFMVLFLLNFIFLYISVNFRFPSLFIYIGSTN